VEPSPTDLSFLDDNQSAAMITVGADGMPKAVRVGVGLVDGKLWSSGTADRARTARLREDPRCTLFVFDDAYGFLTLETTVTILDGPDVPDQSVRFFRTVQGKPEGPLSWFGGELDEAAFRQAMVDEHRIIYEFTPTRAYGLH
jgi:PPOX class probable F420-dependent enzyme